MSLTEGPREPVTTNKYLKEGTLKKEHKTIIKSDYPMRTITKTKTYFV